MHVYTWNYPYIMSAEGLGEWGQKMAILAAVQYCIFAGVVGGSKGMYSFCQLMTAYMPTFIGRNITGIRPTHDCFYANLGHIMTAD